MITIIDKNNNCENCGEPLRKVQDKFVCMYEDCDEVDYKDSYEDYDEAVADMSDYYRKYRKEH